MINFYKNEDFKLFPCNLDKSPKVASWRATEAHLSPDDTERIQSTGGFVGAWIPKNYLIIDIDMNHKTKEGVPKPDGMAPFNEFCSSVGITDNLMDETLTVKTGSGGYHLYFKVPEEVDYKELAQKELVTSVDIKTHLGYIIAAGTSGYSVHTRKDPMMLPESILSHIKKRNLDKAKDFTPIKILPSHMLKKILDKIEVANFSTNDSWQEMITACIATCGNAPEVLDILEEWSQRDPSYTHDKSVRKRIETFEPDGGITAGTFLYILKKEEISKYMIDKVRMIIGAEFSFSDGFAEYYNVPFIVDYSLIHENLDLMKAFYYMKHQTAGLTLFTKLVKDNLFYVENEKRFYYYNGNRWVESTGMLNILFTVLLQAGQRFYSDISKKKDADAADYISAYIGYIGALQVQQRFESALKQHPDIARNSVQWDGPELEATLTLDESVMDFKGKDITFRKGGREEYRRLYINLNEKDFDNREMPVNFRQFLKDVFPDDGTRKTATYALSTMLSGTGKFRKFQIWNGSGNNGKSTLMNIMREIIGKERAVTYTPGILLAQKNQSSLTPEMAALRGSLVAFSSETNESKRVSEGAIKQLTGDETVTANPKYQGMIEFETTFQLVLATNYLPAFSAHDNAFVNRLLILPFYTCFYDTEEKKENGERSGSRYFSEAKDVSKLKNEIYAEKAQILYYLARRYQELDFNIPESQECLDAKAHYIKDNNDIVDMIHEVFEFDDTRNFFTPTKDIIDYYNEDQNTKYTSRFIIARVKDVFPLVENHSKRINGKLTRGLKHIRLKYGVYPEGYTDNFSEDEIEQYNIEEGGF